MLIAQALTRCEKPTESSHTKTRIATRDNLPCEADVPGSKPPEQTQTWRFVADIQAPAAARGAARRFLAALRAAPEDMAGLVLCVSEAVTNAVLHAYRDAKEPGSVEVEIATHGAHVWITVRDRGQGLTPRIGSPGLGVGLPIISQIADETEIRTPQEGGTEIAMRFGLTA
jgi:anti-sigma regulatory factor (Ser/Thr protein kinase)